MPQVEDCTDTAEELLHVLDLPQLHEKPSSQTLLHTLNLLAIQAPSWDRDNKVGNGQNSEKSRRQQVAPEGVPKYLTSIVASQLRWIQDDEQKEEIWESASLRLAERSGRTAMPAMSRSFVIPDGTANFELSIYEPSLTGDSLGFKTWAASYLLSKRLHALNIPSSQTDQLRVLELGSGTGLVGMAAAAVLGASVLLTDLPEIEGNLTKNVLQNQTVILEHGGVTKTAILDWTNPTEIIASASSMATTDPEWAGSGNASIKKFPVIVAADSIYSAEHPAMLVEAIRTWLARDRDARVINELPRREGYSAEIQNFRERMLHAGLHILEEGEEMGYDDWGGHTEDERQEVNCWWSIWSWATIE